MSSREKAARARQICYAGRDLEKAVRARQLCYARESSSREKAVRARQLCHADSSAKRSLRVHLHPSAYVSIRQHTSAYVSSRETAMLKRSLPARTRVERERWASGWGGPGSRRPQLPPPPLEPEEATRANSQPAASVLRPSAISACGLKLLV